MKKDYYEALFNPNLNGIDVQDSDIQIFEIKNQEDFISIYLTLENKNLSELYELHPTIQNSDVKQLLDEIIYQKHYEELKRQHPLPFRISKNGFSGKKFETQLNELKNDEVYIKMKKHGIEFLNLYDYPFIASKAIIWALSSANEIDICFSVVNEAISVYQGNLMLIQNLNETKINLLFINGFKKELFSELQKSKNFFQKILYKITYIPTMKPERFIAIFSFAFFIFFIYFPNTFFVLFGFLIVSAILSLLFSAKLGNHLLQTQLIYVTLLIILATFIGYILNIILHLGT